jgi:hypothetical protein
LNNLISFFITDIAMQNISKIFIYIVIVIKQILENLYEI